MHRFYLPPEQTGSDTIRLEGREAHHAVDVLRLRRGDTAEILNGSGEIFTFEVVEADKSKVAARVIKMARASATLADHPAFRLFRREKLLISSSKSHRFRRSPGRADPHRTRRYHWREQ